MNTFKTGLVIFAIGLYVSITMYEYEMMSMGEGMSFILSIVLTLMFFSRWYSALFRSWLPGRTGTTKFVLGLLPPLSGAFILYILKSWASYDVVNSDLYTAYYLIMGMAWLYLGLWSMSAVFDLSWVDDALNMNNRAALFGMTGGLLGLTCIYAGANIGDGPGWWCVIFAGGLGGLAWLALGLFVESLTSVFECVTVERDLGSGIRLGFYLFASGIILGRASAGDWTSFEKTVVEFMDGWPVLFLAALAIVVERRYLRLDRSGEYVYLNTLSGSLLWGIIYLFFAAGSVMLLPPLVENPLYKADAVLYRLL